MTIHTDGVSQYAGPVYHFVLCLLASLIHSSCGVECALFHTFSKSYGMLSHTPRTVMCMQLLHVMQCTCSGSHHNVVHLSSSALGNVYIHEYGHVTLQSMQIDVVSLRHAFYVAISSVNTQVLHI